MKIPQGVKVEITGGELKITGPKSTQTRRFDARVVQPVVNGDELEFKLKRKENRRYNAVKNALQAHAKNMLHGATGEFQKTLEVAYAHFPISIEVKGSEVHVKNFLGEKVPRKAKIVGATKVKVDAKNIIVIGNDKESVGQTASNIAKTTKVRGKDVRIFQDGIYYAD